MKTVAWLAAICAGLLTLHVIALALQLTIPELLTTILRTVTGG